MNVVIVLLLSIAVVSQPVKRMVGTWNVKYRESGRTNWRNERMRVAIDGDSLRFYTENILGNWDPFFVLPATPKERGPKGLVLSVSDTTISDGDTMVVQRSLTVTKQTKRSFTGFYYYCSFTIGKGHETIFGGSDLQFQRVR